MEFLSLGVEEVIGECRRGGWLFVLLFASQTLLILFGHGIRLFGTRLRRNSLLPRSCPLCHAMDGALSVILFPALRFRINYQLGI